MNPSQNNAWQPPPIDPLLAHRVAQLHDRRPAVAPKAVAGSKPGRRVKPARAAKLSALAMSAVTTLGFTAAFAHQDSDTEALQLSAIAVAPATTVTTTAETTETTAITETTAATETTAITETTAATTNVSATAAGVADGTYPGEGDTSKWGTVQVQVVYSGGVITDVQILQYPDSERKSVQINQSSLPRLISESLSSQSSDVNTVSGATYTSVSYRASLQSAIDAAKAASGISA